MEPSPRLRSIHVVAAVITDARGRVLLARRDGTSDLAGLWEFPGGKREPGETPEQALVRELQEELDVTVEVGPALMQVPQQYPGKRLRLDVRQVTAWEGTPRGHEGQALAWVTADRLARYSMPPADLPVVAALRQPDRYLVTPEPGADDAAWLDALRRAVAGGIRRVHLRAPGLAAADPGRWHRLLHAVVACLHGTGTELLVGADIGLARELGIGVHLRAAQLAGIATRPLPEHQPVAASCHTAGELRAAQALGCDFAVVGAIHATATHPGMRPMGWDGFEALRETVALPLYAIGGLAPADIGQARSHGAQGIAAIRALWPVTAVRA